MDRVQVLMVGLPMLLIFADLVNIFSSPPASPPPKPSHHNHHHHHHHHQQKQQQQQPAPPQLLDFPSQAPPVIGGGIGFGSFVKIDFCSSCSYKGTALAMKRMLESQFPGIKVVLENYPPPLPKRILAKLVPAVQVMAVGIVMAGDQVFPMLGINPPPAWYYSLRANKFGTIASTWLLGNALQSFLQSSGAFEVYCNNDLVFSKLQEGRFPGEIELKDAVGRRLVRSTDTDV